MRASRALIGQPLPNERVEGAWGNREVPPHEAKEGGLVGETWFPPRERAAGERRSCRYGFQRNLQLLERADDDEPVPRGPLRIALAAHEGEKVLALQPEGLRVRDLRAVDVAGACPPLPIRRRRLLRRLVIDGDLSLELHVVED